MTASAGKTDFFHAGHRGAVGAGFQGIVPNLTSLLAVQVNTGQHKGKLSIFLRCCGSGLTARKLGEEEGVNLSRHTFHYVS